MNKISEIEEIKKGGKILGAVKIQENKWRIRKIDEIYRFNVRLSNVTRIKTDDVFGDLFKMEEKDWIKEVLILSIIKNQTTPRTIKL